GRCMAYCSVRALVAAADPHARLPRRTRLDPPSPRCGTYDTNCPGGQVARLVRLPTRFALTPLGQKSRVAPRRSGPPPGRRATLSQSGMVIGPAVSIGAIRSSARVSRKMGDSAPREPDRTGATYNGFVRRAGCLTAD